MRVSTAFNRLLQIPGAWVTDVVVGERDVEVTLRSKARCCAARAAWCARRSMTGATPLATPRPGPGSVMAGL